MSGYIIELGMAIRLIFGLDSDSYKNPSKNKTDSPRIPDSYFDGFRIQAIFQEALKKNN